MPGHPLAKRGAPHWPPYRPSDAPPGARATASLTGLPTGHKGTAIGGRPSHRPSLAIRGGHTPPPHWPPKGRDGTPSPGPPPDWPTTGGGLWPHGRPSPTPPPDRLATYGSLRPTWPSGAGGHRRTPLPTLPGHRTGRGQKQASRSPTDWAKGGGGFSRAKGADALLRVLTRPPLGPPYPSPTPTPPDRLTGGTFPPRLAK